MRRVQYSIVHHSGPICVQDSCMCTHGLNCDAFDENAFFIDQ